MSKMNATTTDSGATSAPTSGAPMWRLTSQWAHYGDRLDDAMREAIDAPNSRCMHKRAAGQTPTHWDYVMDVADVLERVL